MRQSLMSTLLFLRVLVFASQSLAQQIPASSPLPLIADTSANETDRLRGLQLLNAKTVYLIVRLEPEAREGPKPGDRREKMAHESLDLAMYWETRLKVVKSRKDADLTFLNVGGVNTAASTRRRTPFRPRCWFPTPGSLVISPVRNSVRPSSLSTPHFGAIIGYVDPANARCYDGADFRQHPAGF